MARVAAFESVLYGSGESASADPALTGMGGASLDIAWIDLDADPQPLDRCLALLDAEECDRAARFRFDRDRRWFVRRHAWLRARLAAHLNCAPAAIAFARSVFGKPFVAGSALRFSLSHAHGMALAVIAHRDVGCDLARDDPAIDPAAIAEGFFTPTERAALRALDPTRRREAFFLTWTRKEAFVKARGLGLSRPFDSFEVSVDPENPALGRGCEGWSIMGFAPRGGWYASVVVRN